MESRNAHKDHHLKKGCTINLEELTVEKNTHEHSAKHQL